MQIPAWVYKVTYVAFLVLLAPLYLIWVDAIQLYSATLVAQRALIEAKSQQSVESIIADGSITAYDKMKDAMEGDGAQAFLAWRALNKNTPAPVQAPFDTSSATKRLQQTTPALRGSKS